MNSAPRLFEAGRLSGRSSTVTLISAVVVLAVLAGGIIAFLGEPSSESSAVAPTDPSAASPNEAAAAAPEDGGAATTAEQQVEAAMDDAIARLKSGNGLGFLEFYAPVDELRLARRGEIGNFYQRVQTDTAMGNLVKRLELARTTKPQIQLGGFLATFTLPEKEAEPADALSPEPGLQTSTEPLATYEGNLSKTLEQAIADLQGNQVERFVDRLFPRSELGHPAAGQRRKRLLTRLAQHPVMLDQMLQDLRTVSQTQEVDQATGKVATITVKGQLTPGSRGRQHQLPDRTFHFEQVEGAWRFKDSATDLRKSQTKIAAQASPSLSEFGAADIIIMERFGDRWRFQTY